MHYKKISILAFFLLCLIQTLKAQETKKELGLKGKVKEFRMKEQKMGSVYHFDEEGNLKETNFISARDEKHNRTTTYTYANGILISAVMNAVDGRKIKNTYKNGKMILMEWFENGTRLGFEKNDYDNHNNLIKKRKNNTAYNIDDRIEYKYTYDDKNRVTRQETFEIDGAIKKTMQKTTFKYNKDGEKTEIANYSSNNKPTLDNKVIFSKDSLGNKTKIYLEYNSKGEVSSSQFTVYSQTPNGRKSVTVFRYYMGPIHTISTYKYNKHDDIIFYSYYVSENEAYYREKARDKNMTSKKVKTSKKATQIPEISTPEEKKIEAIKDPKMLLTLEKKHSYLYDKEENWVKKITFSKSKNGSRRTEEHRIIKYYP